MLSLFLVCLISGIVASIVAWRTRGMAFLGVDSDAEKQVEAASHSHQWQWPSDMHRYAKGKAWMKDVGVLGVAALQRLLRDFKTEYPLTLLCGLANVASAILVFVVADAYWSTRVAWLLFALYLTSFWPYQIILLGSTQILAQFFFLLAVWFFQQAPAGEMGGPLLWSVAGMAVGLMMFSSASARKFLPLVAGAFLWSQRRFIVFPSNPPGVILWISLGISLASLSVGLVLLGRAYPLVIRALYERRAPRWLHGLLPSRDKLPLDHYLKARRRVVLFAAKVGGGVVLFLAACLFLSRSWSLYGALVWTGLGAFAVTLFLIWPNPFAHLRGFLSYWNSNRDFNHFPLYRELFLRMGKPLSPQMRRAGPLWLPRFFWLTVPFHLVGMAFALLGLGGILFVQGFPQRESWEMLGVLTLTLSPVLYGELTRSAQVGRAYFPAFLGILAFLGYTVFQVEPVLSLQQPFLFWTVAWAFVGIGALWNLWILLSDVWPARMAVTYLGRTLERFWVRGFTTYDTPYNDAFVFALPAEVRSRYEIRFITRLEEVSHGYVVTPGTSAKALNMESQRWAIENGDFRLDPLLNSLIETKTIERYAVACFKTFGSSRVWVHESEITTYRDLILREIGPRDRFRGRAWILDAGRLAADRATKQGTQRVIADEMSVQTLR